MMEKTLYDMAVENGYNGTPSEFKTVPCKEPNLFRYSEAIKLIRLAFRRNIFNDEIFIKMLIDKLEFVYGSGSVSYQEDDPILIIIKTGSFHDIDSNHRAMVSCLQDVLGKFTGPMIYSIQSDPAIVELVGDCNMYKLAYNTIQTLLNSYGFLQCMYTMVNFYNNGIAHVQF